MRHVLRVLRHILGLVLRVFTSLIWLGAHSFSSKTHTDSGIIQEYEQLKEIEAENKVVDDEDHDSLRGDRLIFKERYTGRQSTGVSDETVQSEMKKSDMWSIASERRGPVYRHMQQTLKAAITKEFRELARQYAAASHDAKIGLWELDYNHLKGTKVIGMTTTGLSKYRGLIQSLNPKVVLIEEAAETLEAAVSVACFKSLEHLVLVGDHQQLRGHCNDEELAGPPYCKSFPHAMFPYLYIPARITLQILEISLREPHEDWNSCLTKVPKDWHSCLGKSTKIGTHGRVTIRPRFSLKWEGLPKRGAFWD